MRVRNRSMRLLVSLVAVFAAAALLAGCSSQPGEAAVGVNAVAADPGAYTGEITMKGVVQLVDAEKGFINIIDLTEYETCGLTPCGSAGIIPLFMPTSGEPSPAGSVYKGSLPALEEEVLVTGEIKDAADGGVIFDVTRVQRGSTTVIEKSR